MGIRHLRALIVVLIVVLGVARAACAHEIGATQVTMRFARDHTYAIDVATDPASLLAKIEHRRVAAAPDVPVRLAAHTRELAAAAEVRFGGVRAAPRVAVLPDGTVRFQGEIPRGAGAFTWRWKLTYSAYPLTIGSRREWLEGDAQSSPLPLARELLPPSRLEVVRQYALLGFLHIVPRGVDHILFVLGIFLLTTRLKSILTQVTAFTLAHSITLGLTMYDVLSVSPRLVEPLIALSIVYVAVENLTTTELRRSRVAVVFAFGLLHGMGFAGVLRELGLPRREFLPALLAFNGGVEVGQLTVIATAFLLVACWARTKPWYRLRFVVPASVAIALAGLVWTAQRIM
ncbi:MAG TPA: HupE/UreJ family protein [Thermoanaerobaculia bacterium]